MPDHRYFVRLGAGSQALLIAIALVSAVVTACVGGARDTSIDLTVGATPGERAVVVSHRGGGISAPENTLPAVTAALAAGFDYVEVERPRSPQIDSRFSCTTPRSTARPTVTGRSPISPSRRCASSTPARGSTRASDRHPACPR